MLFKYLQFGFRGKVSWNESDLKIKSHSLGGILGLTETLLAVGN